MNVGTVVFWALQRGQSTGVREGEKAPAGRETERIAKWNHVLPTRSGSLQKARGKMVQRNVSHAQENPVTAIDIALKPGAAMVRRARADNARLLEAFPEFFALDATHHPHMTMLQQFVRTAELKKIASAANAVLGKEGVTGWRLKAIGYYYIPSPPLGIAGIVVEPTEDLLRLQRELLDAVAPFTE